MTTLYAAVSLGLLVVYWLAGHYWSDSVLLLFAAVMFSVKSAEERIINHLDGTKQETPHGRRRHANTKAHPHWYRVRRTGHGGR